MNTNETREWMLAKLAEFYEKHIGDVRGIYISRNYAQQVDPLIREFCNEVLQAKSAYKSFINSMVV